MPHIAVEGAKEDWFSTCPLLPNRQRGRYAGTTQTTSQGIWIRRRDWKETSKQTTATESRRKEPLAGTRPRAKRKTPSERLQHSDDRHSDRGGVDETALTPETRVVTLRLSTAPHASAITVHNNIRATATLFSSLRCPYTALLFSFTPDREEQCSSPAVDCRAHHRSRAQKETSTFPRRRLASRGDLGARRSKNRSARKQSVSEVLHIGRDEGDEIQGAAVKKVRRRSSASEVHGTLVLADGAIRHRI